MTKKMLIDATHAEETRVAVVDDNRIENFDYESTVRKQLKGSIFLAKVTRVEPSLQAAFVNFGGNRHGFLPFSEIHPDYFRIPISDREALLEAQREEMKAMQVAEEAADKEDDPEDLEDDLDDEIESLDDTSSDEKESEKPKRGRKKAPVKSDEKAEDKAVDKTAVKSDEKADKSDEGKEEKAPSDSDDVKSDDAKTDEKEDKAPAKDEGKEEARPSRGRSRGRGGRSRGRGGRRMSADSRRVEIVGGDEVDGERPMRPSLRKNYKIQEVIKRGQIMLIQASKEERGNKGAAVTSYISLPGRYCVLMPNSPRGGGVSRKIANFKDRKRMREILAELQVPEGMSVIMRTAGVERTKAEIKRDLDYLMRLWDNIRSLTLSSSAPAVVHEEGHLIRRSIRDIYTRDVEEVLVSGEEGFKTARDFMKMMIPSHSKRVKLYEDEKIPLFHRYQVEKQIGAMGNPEVVMKSGGSIVINPTEALVSVDVNSGRATKERHIEETALKTNLEAADEVARQLRLRDLGGLVVIDFIDMEERRNNRKVEQRLKQALSTDRARIQIGRISSFGLMELSRQRLNPALTESQFQRCPHCEGVGYISTTDSAAITVLRALMEEGIQGRAEKIAVHIPNIVALYILNNKRDMLVDIEQRYGFKVLIQVDDTLPPSGMRIEVLKNVPCAAKAGAKENGNKDSGSGSGSGSGAAGKVNDGDKNEGSQRRGGRRRGRRGGRNRGGRDETNRNDNVQAVGNTVGQKSETSPRKEPEANGNKVPSKEKVAPDVNGNVKEKETNKKTAPKKVAPKKTESRAKNVTEATPKEKAKPDVKAKAVKAPAAKKKVVTSKAEPKKAPAVKKAKTTKAAASNDSEPPAAKAHETVNESPKKKKKGWWNKLVD